MTAAGENLLQVRDLQTRFVLDEGTVTAVDGVSFDVAKGEIVGIVGESGCGKSVTNLSVLGLLPKPQGRISKGSVLFEGRELVGLSENQLRQVRGNNIAMIFQDPMTSLNPYLRVEEQLAEVVQLHLGLDRKAAVARAVELLRRVGIPDAAARIKSYPHEFSGGMRQRVMIAMALLCDPELLIADEPTTALDVTIQAQILELLKELRAERQMGIILITHDLGVVAGMCDRVLVMYAGRIVEEAPTHELFANPQHPYTQALLKSVPRLDEKIHETLFSIEGLPPRLDKGPFTGCTFAPRCPLVREACHAGEPALEDTGGGRKRRCVVPVEELA
ncbi:MAG: ABC transporter ATP-binding protein [Planctomycetota bacterium]|nr:ABC transporter ATP-binding protein [Planctomycetota bacterium]